MKSKYKVRPWQAKALKAFEDKLEQSQNSNFLCVATPGAGKTTFALVCARHLLGRNDISKIIIIVPSAHLKEQWADAGADLGLLLDTDVSDMSPQSFGVVATYQGVAANPQAFQKLSKNAFVILDEIHHAGDDKTWGDSLRLAFTGATTRLLLSGTPFRSDANAIPFVKYVNDELIVDFEYGYEDALKDGGVVRPIKFTRLDGHMEWIDTDGEFNSFSFAQAIDTKRIQQRLNVSLNKDGAFLSNSLSRANRYLKRLRKIDPTAAALVICIDHAHAKVIASLLRKLGAEPTVVLSDDPKASEKISDFATSTTEWLVAVRMVSEGVDIPRLRVGVFATNTTTELFFRQAVGRFVRLRAAGEEAMMFIPNDPRIVSHAQTMAQSRVHVLKRNEDDDSESIAFDNIVTNDESWRDDEQLSMFQVLSSTPLHSSDDVLDSPMSARSKNKITQTIFEGIEIDLPPLPVSMSKFLPALSKEMDLRKLRRTRKALRDLNTERVRTLATFSGEKHSQINARLNTMAGITSITKATLEQLEVRLGHANKLLKSHVKS